MGRKGAKNKKHGRRGGEGTETPATDRRQFTESRSSTNGRQCCITIGQLSVNQNHWSKKHPVHADQIRSNVAEAALEELRIVFEFPLQEILKFFQREVCLFTWNRSKKLPLRALSAVRMCWQFYRLVLAIFQFLIGVKENVSKESARLNSRG